MISPEKQILHDCRLGAEFCIHHGLVFPPGSELQSTDDEEKSNVNQDHENCN